MARLTFDELTQLYLDTKHKITQPELWLNFLDTACRNFRLPFDDQVLIYAQRPDVTAVLPTGEWTQRFGRWVNRGTNGIAVFDFSGRSLSRMKYYFDISDTHASRYARLVPLWEVLPEFQGSAIDALENEFGPLPDKSSLPATIFEATKVVMEEHFDRWWEMFLKVKDDSDLSEVPEMVMRSNYRDFLELSVAYCTMRRCGIDARSYIRPDEFRGIEQFNTLETTNSLGVPTAFMAQRLLDAVAFQIKPLYRVWQLEHREERGMIRRKNEQNVERSVVDGNGGHEGDRSGAGTDQGEGRPRTGDPLHPGERVLDPGAEVPGAGEGIPHGHVGPVPHGVAGGERSAAAGEPDHHRDAAGLLDGTSGTGMEPDGVLNEADGGTGGRDGGTEAPGSDGMGRADEQHPGTGERTGVSRSDLSLIIPLVPTQEEQIEEIKQAEADTVSAFAVSQEDIDAALQTDNGMTGRKVRIFFQIQKQEGLKSNAAFLKREHGTEGRSFTFPDGMEGWISFDPSGMKIRKNGPTQTAEQRLTWSQTAKHVMRLCRDGRYLTGEEQAEYQSWRDAATPEEELLESARLRYQEEDVAYLQGDPYIITRLTDSHVWLQDLEYPMFTADYDREEFEVLLRQDDRNGHLIAPDAEHSEPEQDTVPEAETDSGPEPPVFSTTTEAIYPSGESGLPYDIVVETLHIEEPELEAPEQTEEKPGEEPDSIETVPEPPGPAPEPEIPAPQRRDYRITADDLGVGKPDERYRNNVAAIRCLKRIEAEARLATPEEQKILARYVGWGGLADCFDARHNKYNKYRELKALMTEEEYAAARESTLTAFFTPPAVIRAVYQGLERLGFRRGNILEPSCGIGNFMGMLPEAMQDSRFYGVELDSISGRIASQLYQSAKISVQGYEDTELRDNWFDVAVGNVPFGQFKVSDSRYNSRNWLIHDYFFGKTLDKVRPGGVIAFITSKGTLDKENPAVRRYIAQRAKLIGAIRLPNTTFKEAAGTEVTSDLIFLQKRESVVDAEPEWVHLGLDENGIAINAYFLAHPEMILGEMKLISGPHGPESACVPRERDNLDALLAQAVTQLQGGVILEDREPVYDIDEASEEERIEVDPALPNYSYCVVDGDLYFKKNGGLHPAEAKSSAIDRIKGMVDIRDCARALIRLETGDFPEAEIKAQQARLNALYDSFSVKYGHLTDRANAQAMREDTSYPLLASLEEVDSQGNYVAKSAFFTKRTIKPKLHIDKVGTAVEALEVSMAEKVRVDMELMTRLTGKSESELYEELHGVIFLNPEWEEGRRIEKYLTADEYLSGNVREKLRIAQTKAALAPELYSGHVAALQGVQPAALTATEISVRLGATWLPPEIVKKFGLELFQAPFWMERSIDVQYAGYTAEWRIVGKHAQGRSVLLDNVYGTDRINGWEILEQTLNLREVSVYDYMEVDGRKKGILNQKETILARGKQEQIKRKFEDWVWADPERRDQLCAIYNERFNSHRTREYDGSFLELVGINPEITLRTHQINAVARIILGGNTLLAHVMSAGKTYTMVAAAMESKRLGLCHKSLIVVPNSLTGQWGAEFMRLYPSANILVAKKRDFERQNRKAFCARIATGDYDAVIIGHSQFERIPLSLAKQREMLERQLDEILDMISEAKYARGEQFTVKQLEKSKKSIRAKLEKLNDQSQKDDLVTFEELGIDRLFVDEAHFYKNLAVFSKMRNVAGITQTEAKKSSDLYLKCRYLDEITGGRGVVFATGTPISNSMVELYTMQKYLQYGALARNGLLNFDAWAANFGETVTAIELSPTGTGYRSKTRFARFYNLPELMMMYREIADIQTTDTLELPLPKAIRDTVVLPPSDTQRAMVAELGKRAERIHSGMVSPAEDNMLLITNDGRKLALDQRLVDPLLPPSPTGKSAACAQQIYQTWLDTADRRGTQLVFCDISTPQKPIQMQPDGQGNYEMDPGQFTNIYEDVKAQLIQLGIPPAEIAFIHDATTESKRDALFAKVRDGQVRVLMGSTSKLGTGTNVQTKVVRIHHLDCPYRPVDLQQQDARGVRVGNENKEVLITTYVTEGTFDAYLYQMVERKQKFIGQIQTSKSPVRSIEDVDAQALVYAEVKALSSGDARIKEKMDLEVDVAKLRLYKADHLTQRYALEDKIHKALPKEIQHRKEEIEGYRADIALAQKSVQDADGFFGPMVIEGHVYTDKQSAGKALLAAIATDTGIQPVTIGSYRGFTMSVCTDMFGAREVLLCGELKHPVAMGRDVLGNIQRLDNAFAKLTDHLADAERSLVACRQQLEIAKQEVQKPFPQEEELAQKEARLAQLNIELDLDHTSAEVLEEDEPAAEVPVKTRMEVSR